MERVVFDFLIDVDNEKTLIDLHMEGKPYYDLSWMWESLGFERE